MGVGLKRVSLHRVVGLLLLLVVVVCGRRQRGVLGWHGCCIAWWRRLGRRMRGPVCRRLSLMSRGWSGVGSVRRVGWACGGQGRLLCCFGETQREGEKRGGSCRPRGARVFRANGPRECQRCFLFHLAPQKQDARTCDPSHDPPPHSFGAAHLHCGRNSTFDSAKILYELIQRPEWRQQPDHHDQS